MRLFIALDISADWREAAVSAIAAIAPAAPGALRPVDPSLMHLTLRFLGEVDEPIVPALQAALDREVPPVDVTLSLGAAGTFGPPARTTVAWLGVGGDTDGLAALAALAARTERAERAVIASALPPDGRPLRPHLTLARVARGASTGARRAIAEAVAGLPAPRPAPFRAREIALVRSHLGGPRPRYEVLSHHG